MSRKFNIHRREARLAKDRLCTAQILWCVCRMPSNYPQNLSRLT